MEPRRRCGPLVTLASVVLALFSAGCAADSPDRVEAEVNQLVQIGMPLTTAAAALTSAGFTCSSNDRTDFEPADMLCTRSRSHRLLATCIQRVLIVADTAKVARVTVPPPACASV